MTEDVKAKVLAMAASAAVRHAEVKPGFAARAIAREERSRARAAPSPPRQIGVA